MVRGPYPVEDHPVRGRVFAAEVRDAYTADPTGKAGGTVAALLEASPEFADVGRLHEVGVTRHHELKRCLRPGPGELQPYAEMPLDPEQCQTLLVFTAVPGSPSHDGPRLLATADGRTR